MGNTNIGTLLTINVSRPPWPSYLPIVDDVNSPSSAKLRPTHSREKLGYGGRPNPRSNCSLHPSRPSRSTRVVAILSAPIKASTTRLGGSPPLVPPSRYIRRDCRGLALSLHRSPIGGAYSNISQPPYTASFYSIRSTTGSRGRLSLWLSDPVLPIIST